MSSLLSSQTISPVILPIPLVTSTSYPPIKPPDPRPNVSAPFQPSPFVPSLSPVDAFPSNVASGLDSIALIVSWARLFKGKPKSTGRFEPRQFDLNYSGGPLIVPLEIREVGIKYWDRHLFGFSVGKCLSYTTVTTYIRKAWKPKLKGGFEIESDGKCFFFDFACVDDRLNILQSDPLFIKGEMFVITNWDSSFGCVNAQIRSILIWVQLHNIPLIFWTLLGIIWIACHVGKVVCFNESTERMVRFEYAKVLVENSPEKDPPACLDMRNLGVGYPNVVLKYDWVPSICTNCKVFGHSTVDCINKQTRVDEVESLVPHSSSVSSIPNNGSMVKKAVNGKVQKQNISMSKEVNKGADMMKDIRNSVGLVTESITSPGDDEWIEVKKSNKKKNSRLSRFAVKKSRDPSMKRKLDRLIVHIDKCATNIIQNYRELGNKVSLDVAQARQGAHNVNAKVVQVDHCASDTSNDVLYVSLNDTGLDSSITDVHVSLGSMAGDDPTFSPLIEVARMESSDPLVDVNEGSEAQNAQVSISVIDNDFLLLSTPLHIPHLPKW